ncbi:MAG: AI-2E family transporter [Ilumatobacteraceae bacterium]
MSDEVGGYAGSGSAQRMPRWVWKAVAVLWLGYLGTIAALELWNSLYSLFVLLLLAIFLALAIEPGVNRLAQRGWRRGAATGLILFSVVVVLGAFIGAVGALVGQQVADLLRDSETYVTRTVNFLNDNVGTNIDAASVIAEINDPNGSVQQFIDRQQSRVFDLSVAALGYVLQALSVLLFTFYLVADGPKLRRVICSRLRPERQRAVLDAWDIAIDKTGGYLYSRALLAGFSALLHWVVFQFIGTPAPVAMAVWVGVVSQFLPVVGTYLAGALPALLTFVDSPGRAAAVIITVVVYQQLENYLLVPRITSRTMNLHPAIAFGAAIGGGAVMGAVGAVLAIPGAAMVQALLSGMGTRHDLVDERLHDSAESAIAESAVDGSSGDSVIG